MMIQKFTYIVVPTQKYQASSTFIPELLHNREKKKNNDEQGLQLDGFCCKTFLKG